MKRRVLAIVVCLCMLATMWPQGAAMADGNETTSIKVGGRILSGSDVAPVYATTNGENGEVTVQESYVEGSQWNIKWDGSTLTLRGATIKAHGVDSTQIAAIHLSRSRDNPQDIVIKLEEDNKLIGAALNTSQSGSYSEYSYGIYSASGDITISGNGALTFDGENQSANSSNYRAISSGIYANNGNVNIESGTITINAGSATAISNASAESYGIYAWDYNDTGIGNVTISGGNVTVMSGEANAESGEAYSCGIRTRDHGSVIISGGSVTAQGGSATAMLGNNYSNCILTADNITVSPQSGKLIKVAAGESKDRAEAIEGSPFMASETITDKVQNTKYFYGETIDATTINNHPSSQQVIEGGTATFKIEATGTGLSYQWQQKSTGSDADWQDIPDANTDSYTIANVEKTMNGYRYQCVVTGEGGKKTSNAAILTVYAKTVITEQPDNTTVKEGDTAIFNVTAFGEEPLSYQWQESVNGSIWSDISGANSSSYTMITTTMGMDGHQYRCVVTGTGGDKAISQAAKLTVQKMTETITPGDTVRYIVEHYTQKDTGSYTLYETEYPAGEIGERVTASPKEYQGYVYNPNVTDTIESGMLKEIDSDDDIVTLKLYYDRIQYSITVTSDGNGSATASETSAAEGTSITLSATAKSGYHFERWKVVSDNVAIENNSFTMPAEDVTIKAVFARNSGGGGTVIPSRFTLTFDTNGGSAIDAMRVSAGTTVDLSDYQPTRAGYDFTGWYADEALTEHITNIRMTGNKTVYAGWTQQTPPVEAELPFIDVDEDDWFYDPVRWVFEQGLMTGTSATTFEPNISTTRGMIVSIFHRLEGSPMVSESLVYDDVVDGDWYAEAVRWATTEDIVGGFGDGTFRPNEPITREQMASILYRYAEYKGYDISARADLSAYSDQPSAWAEDVMQWAVAEGLLNGVTDDQLQPQGNATRAQVAAIFQRFLSE